MTRDELIASAKKLNPSSGPVFAEFSQKRETLSVMVNTAMVE